MLSRNRLVIICQISLVTVLILLVDANVAPAGPFDVERKITANDAAELDQFGTSVGISGNVAIVGGYGYNNIKPNKTGSAYLFDATIPTQLHKLLANDGAVGDEFGISVGVSGNRAIVGADADSDAGNSSGSAYLFDVNTGSQLFKLTAADATSFDRFGYSVAISGNKALVGAYTTGATTGIRRGPLISSM